MKRFLTIVGYGLGGILVALALSLGAFALAGRQLGGPASPVEPALNLSDSPTPSWEPSFEPTQTHTPKPKPKPKPDPKPDATHTQSAPPSASTPTAAAPSPTSGGSGTSSGGDGSGGDGSEDPPGDD